MTECITDAVEFTRHARRKVVADFRGGRLTSDAGVLLLREVDRQLGLIDAVNDCLPDPRSPPWIIHEQRSMLAQRVFSIALGYEDLNDHQAMRFDPALQTAVGSDPDEDCPLASPSTLCRLENRVNRKSLMSARRVSTLAGACAVTVGHSVMQFVPCAVLIFAVAVAAHAASEIWLSPVGMPGGGVVQGVANLRVKRGANEIYIWGRPEEGETLRNLSLNVRSTTNTVLDFTEVVMDNPLLVSGTFGEDFFRYSAVNDSVDGILLPSIDPDGFANFGGFTLTRPFNPGVGIGPATTDLDPLYDAVADAFRIATVAFDVAGPFDSTTELFLQIGVNGANLDGKGHAETLIVFGDPQDPPLTAATDRDIDSATFDARLTVVPEPPSILLAVIALAGWLSCCCLARH